MSGAYVGRRNIFTGVLNIVRFNPGFFVSAVVVASYTGCSLVYFESALPRWLHVGGWFGFALALWWWLASLFVSWWVYDLSGLYRWQWLEKIINTIPDPIFVAHAGFDEVTASLRDRFPEREMIAIDFHDPEKMTEPSIRRARAICPPLEGTISVGLDRWEVPKLSGAVLFLLSAHEWRKSSERVLLLRAASETLAEDGVIVLLEHLRDFPNFVAFGPGYFHFHSKKSWQRDWGHASLECQKQFRVTPFLGGFVLRKTGRGYTDDK